MSDTSNPVLESTHLLHTDRIEAEAAKVVSLLEGVHGDDWSTQVATTPDWTLRKLAVHIGGAHRWANTMVSTLTPERANPRSVVLNRPDSLDELPSWIAKGAADLVATLRNTPGDAAMWTWGTDQHARFWSRRMLHETAIHRADVELTLGLTPEYDIDVAVDGIDEYLDNLPNAVSFEPRIRNLTGDGEMLHFHATDEAAATREAEWLITLEPHGFRWSRSHAKGAAAVRGSVSDLYLFAWGRRTARADGIEVLGDETLVDHWVQNASF